MKFFDNIIKFRFANTPIIGNLSNGHCIGLSADGESLCDRLFIEDIPQSELEDTDPILSKHLAKYAFFDCPEETREVLSAYLHVTHRCNLNCVGCYSYTNDRNLRTDPSLNEIKRALDELVSVGVRSLIISGGEPFLRTDIADIVCYAKDVGIELVSIVSNGTILDENILDDLVQKIDMISLSFDGYNESCTPYIRKKNLFNTLLQAVELIKSRGIALQIVPTIHSKNIDHLDEYANLSKTIDASLSFSLLSAPIQKYSEFDLIPNDAQLSKLGATIYSRSKKSEVQVSDSPLGLNLTVANSCGACSKTLSIDPSGDVYPCHMLHSTEYLLGNVFDTGLDSILKSDQTVNFANDFSYLCSECNVCAYKWLCRGGCRARSLIMSKNVREPEPYCPMFRSFFSKFEESLQSQIRK